MSDDVTVDHHVKKKKRKTGGRAPSPKCSHPGGFKENELSGDESFSVNVSYSEHTELEGSEKKKKKKKKNKHRSIDTETFMEVGSSGNLSPSYSQNSFVKYVKQEDTLEHESSNWDFNSNTQKSPKKSKKKKEIKVSLEEADNTGQPNLYDGHFGEASVIEEAPFSESRRKKKKRRRPSETRSLEEDVLEEVQPSPLITLNENINLEDSVRRKKKKHRLSEIRSLEEDVLEDIQPSLLTTLNDNIELEDSVKRKKKKHRSSEIRSLEEDALQDIQPSPMTTLNDNIELEDSVRRKKKKHRPSEIRSLEEDALRYIQPSPMTTLNDNIELEDSVKRKKKKHRSSEIRSLEEDALQDIQPSPMTTLNDNIELEDSVKRKKKKHRSSEIRSLDDALEDIQPSPLTTLNDDIDLLGSVRRKKKKHRPSEIRSLDDALEDIQPSPLTTLNDDIDLLGSVRRKKKKHRPSEIKSLEEDGLEDVQPSPLTTLNDDIDLLGSVRRKKKKHRPSEIKSLEEDGLEDVQPSLLSTLNDNIELEDSVRKKKKLRPSEINNILKDLALGDTRSSLLSTFNDNIDLENSVRMKKRLTEILKEDNMGDETVTEDMSLNGETDLKSTARKKKERSREIKEVHTHTEHSRISKIFKENSPKQSNKDHARAEEKEEREKNFDASEREAFKNITQATNSKTDEGTPAKNNKSAMGLKSKRDRKQDVTAELEESDQDEMEITLDQETSDLQKVNWIKQNKPSAIEILCSLPKRNVALLEEYFPRIRSLSGTCVNDLVKWELNRIEDAKAKGIKFLTGRFESTEDELIKKNVEDFLKILGLESGEMLFHSYKFPAQQHMIDQLKKKYNFRQRIGKGLARTLADVYGRGAKLYDLSGNKGRFTKQEVENLQQLMRVHGKQWTTVARLFGRSSASVQLKASQIKLEVTGGKWNIDEVNRLLEAVKTFIMGALKNKKMLKQKPYTVPKEMLFTGIPWRQIAEKVQTRNWTHCKSKWNDMLLLRMNNGVSPCEGALGLQTNIEIIKWLYENKPQKAQVNWVEMGKTIGNVPTGILQQKVYKLKARHVPDWQKLSFKDIVNYMYMEVLPVFEAKLKEPFSRNAKQMPEKEDKFLIRDIFREYEGNDKHSLSKPFCINKEFLV